MKNVALYFDYASPWAYIADELLPRKLPGITVTHHPIYLRGLETFAKGLPYTGAKLQYLARDLVRVAAHEGVAFVPPVSFPVDGLHARREPPSRSPRSGPLPSARRARKRSAIPRRARLRCCAAH